MNKDLLICFLNSLFNGKQVVKDVSYLNPEHVGDVYTDRKGSAEDNSTDKMGLLLRLPPFMMRLVMKILFSLDRKGKVPDFLIKEDPNQASVFVTNLGSIGLHAGYHHLTNWGTNSIFVVIGEKHMAPFYQEDGSVEMREVIDLGVTLDERIADGYYYSKTIKLLKHLLTHPEFLDQKSNEEVEF